MDMPKHKKHRLLIASAITLAVLSALMTLWIVDRLRFEAREQSRIHKILTMNEALLSSLKDIENGQRGFLLTKDPSYLKPYEDAIANVNDQYDHLSSNTQNPALKQLLSDLKPLIDRRLELVEQILDYERSGRHDLAIRTLSAGLGKQYMDQIRLLMAGFKQKELDILNNRSQQFESTILKLTFAIVITFILSIVFAAALFARIQRLKEDAEEKLNFRNALLRSAEIGIVATDTNLRVVTVNPAAEKLFSSSAEQLIGRHDLSVISNKFSNVTRTDLIPANTTTIDNDPLQLLDGNTDKVQFEASYGSDGTKLSCAITKTKDRDGNLLGFILLASDISQLHLAQNSLRQSEQLYKQSTQHLKKIIDTSIDIICTIDVDGKFVEVGAASEQVWGYVPEEMIGKKFLEFVHPDDRQRTTLEAEIILDGKPARNFQNRYINKDGQVVHMVWSAVWSEEDQLMYAIARDETEALKIAEELKATEKLLKLAGDIAKVGGWSLDLIGEKFFWTPQVCEILEFPVGAMPTLKERLSLYTDESKSRFLEAMEVCKSKGIGFDLQLKTRTKLGRVIDTRLIGQPIANGLGEIVGITGAVQDITEQKNLEQALIDAKEAAISANAAKDVFLSTMSHEIRTPLNGLLGMLELLSYSTLNNDQRDMLTTATDSGKNLVRIINDLLDHSKIEAGKLQILNEVVSLEDLINRLQLSYYALASTKNLTLKKSIDPKIAPCHVLDSLRLTQILGNLLSNAIKFTSSGYVEIRVQRLSCNEIAETLKFSVIDTGIGISEEAQKRMFQPFEQASAETTRLYGGTGLGLSISRKLAEMMGGKLELNSKHNKGSEFTLTVEFPIAQSASATTTIDTVPLIDQQIKFGLKLLIVDDHPVNRKLLSRQLAKLNVAVDSAENGKEAFQKFKSSAYDIVITDCNMPEMDGYELARQIRKHEKSKKLSRTPIIAWTANAMADARDNVIKAGMDDILIKPSELPLVKSKILQWSEEDKSPKSSVAAVPESSKDATLFDLSQMTDDPIEEHEILLDYLKQTEADLDLAKSAWQEGLSQELKRVGHRMKGASRLIGSTAIASLCEKLESISLNEDWELSSACIVGIEAELAKLQQFSLRSNFQHDQEILKEE